MLGVPVGFAPLVIVMKMKVDVIAVFIRRPLERSALLGIETMELKDRWLYSFDCFIRCLETPTRMRHGLQYSLVPIRVSVRLLQL